MKTLFERLRVRTPAELAAAAQAGKVRTLPHFGARSEERILRGLAFLATSHERTPLAAVIPVVEALAATLATLPGVERVVIAGSIRRRKETIGDADLLTVARRPQAAIAAFARVPDVARVLGQGEIGRAHV